MHTNNLKGPRMPKGQFSIQVITRDLWKAFQAKFPEHAKISYTDFKERWMEIADTIRTESIKNPLGVKLGYYTGELKYQYLPHKFKALDNKLSAELGEEVNQLNLLTKGKVGKIKWERRWAVKFNKILQYYAYEPDRRMSKLAKEHTDSSPESIRVARNTLGGKSFWRLIKSNYGK